MYFGCSRRFSRSGSSEYQPEIHIFEGAYDHQQIIRFRMRNLQKITYFEISFSLTVHNYFTLFFAKDQLAGAHPLSEY